MSQGKFLDELVEIYGRYWLDDLGPNSDALSHLAAAIIKIAVPQTVGDVMALPGHGLLRIEGFEYLIERDTKDTYDEVGGYIDVVVDQGLDESGLTPSQYGFNGLQLCEWIDQQFPVKAAT